MMKKFKSCFLIVFFFTILVVGFYFTKNMNVSYAIDPGIQPFVVPTVAFKTNYGSTNINYIKEGLTAAGTSNTNQDKFAVPKDLKIDGTSTPLYLLNKSKIIPGSTEVFEIVTGDNPSNITDNGLLYIIGHGYNNVNDANTIFTTGLHGNVTDNTKKQYVTQIALWLYIYENRSDFATTYCVDDSCILPSNTRSIIESASANASYKYLKYITELVDKANAYSGRATSTFQALDSTSLSYEIDEANSILTTEKITPKSTSNNDNYLYYSVEIEDENNYGVYITDANNNKITNTTKLTGSFKVVVPLKDNINEMNLKSISINVFGYYISDKGLDYRVTQTPNNILDDNKKQKYSDVTLGTVPIEVAQVTFRLFNVVKLSKVDITDSKELPGATIRITKEDDTLVDEYVSESIPHYLYLENGNYKMCETIAPEGYEKQTECITFTVDNNTIKTVVMTNKPIEIPDTGLFKSKLTLIIGTIFILIGGISVFILTLKKKDN